SAGGAGLSPFASRAARTKASTGVRTHSLSSTEGRGGRRTFWSDHQSGPARRAAFVTGLRPRSTVPSQAAPSSIQRRSRAISWAASGFLGGIFFEDTIAHTRLSAARPGRRAGPDSPPLRASGRVLRLSPAAGSSPLWQLTQR